MKTHVRIIVSVLAILTMSSTAYALGLGGYFDLGGGSGTITESYDSYFYYEDDIDVDASHFGIGFTLDTAVGANGVDKFFGYQLRVGYEGLDLEDNEDQTLELTGLIIDNNFQFAFIKGPTLRVWAGPQVRVGFYSGELDSDQDYEATLANFGVGLLIGAQIKVGNNFYICPNLGYRYSAYAGDWEADYGFGEETGDLEGDTNTIFTGVDFLFAL